MYARALALAAALSSSAVASAGAQRAEGAAAARMRADVQALAAMGRIAGSEGANRAATYVLERLAQSGIDTSRQSFAAPIPLPDSVVVERVAPSAMADLPLRLLPAEVLPSADSVAPPGSAPIGLPFAGRGDARGPLVYVNHGRAADLALLDTLRRPLRGAVALARLGPVDPGIVARDVAARGAVALLLYGDPIDDGFMRGDPGPAGPMRHPDAVPRVGVAVPGSTDPAPIPVASLGFRNVLPIFSFLEEGEIPDAWQGALPFRYHSGPAGVVMRVGVWGASGVAAHRQLANALGTLRGATVPEQVIVVGAHRDAWGAGAADNAGGVAVLLEAARRLGDDARRGRRMRRTVVFAAWDGALFERAGSRAWLAARRQGTVAAYLDLDEVVTGPRLAIRASPELQALGEAVALGSTARVRPEEAAGPSRHTSDAESFRRALGVPTLAFAHVGSQGRTGSAYDTPSWLERLADPGYARHAVEVELVLAAVRRLADDVVLPVAPMATVATVRHALDSLRGEPRLEAAPWTDLDRAVNAYARALERFERQRAERSSADADATLLHTLGAFADPAGHGVDGPDPVDGRTVITLPALRAAVRAGRPDAVAAAARGLAARFDAATRRLDGQVASRTEPRAEDP